MRLLLTSYTPASRVRRCADWLVWFRSSSLLHNLRPTLFQGSVPTSFYHLRQGYVNCLVPEAPLFRWMPTKPSFDRSPAFTLKKASCHSLSWWGDRLIASPIMSYNNQYLRHSLLTNINQRFVSERCFINYFYLISQIF